MRQPGTTATVAVRALLHGAASLGLDAARLQSSLGISDAELDSDRGVPPALVAQAWLGAAQLSNDACFGLHVGLAMPLGEYDLLDYLFSTSATLRSACDSAAEYYHLLTEVARVRLVIDGEIARFQHWVPANYVELMRHAWDAFLSGSLLRIKSVVSTPVELVAVRSMGSRPEAADEYPRVFGCPVEFSHPVGELVVASASLEAALRTADLRLHRVLRRAADRLSAGLPQEDSLLSRARTLVDGLASQPDESLRTIAKRLGVSDRSLQRKLREHGLSYRDLLDQARQELALRLLENPHKNVGEVARECGFSSPSSFHRAFVRWRGVAPAEYRRDHLK
jgi:AraC-like DNA-binding protein